MISLLDDNVQEGTMLRCIKDVYVYTPSSDQGTRVFKVGDEVQVVSLKAHGNSLVGTVAFNKKDPGVIYVSGMIDLDDKYEVI